VSIGSDQVLYVNTTAVCGISDTTTASGGRTGLSAFVDTTGDGSSVDFFQAFDISFRGRTEFDRIIRPRQFAPGHGR
jgi:hypothetical protein